jgi:hypothetical protein
MKLAVMRTILILLVTLTSNGCSSNHLTDHPDITVEPQSQPAKEILVTYACYDKPYETLGLIEYTLKSTSTSGDQIELWDQSIDFLKSAALSRYGNKVDAITEVELAESEEENNGKSLNIIHVQGVAISFNGGIKPENKNKVKYKARYKKKPKSKNPKSTSRIKPSKKAPDKPEEDIEISPSELLK